MSVQLPTGDLTSPNSYMNNTHIKFEPGLGSPLAQQQQPMLADSLKMDHSMQEPNILNQHFIAPAGGDDSSCMQPGTAPWPANAVAGGTLPGFPVGSPGSPYDAAGGGGFGSGAQLPADSAASHGSTDLGRMTPGLPQFQEQQSFGGGSAAAAAEPMQMQDIQASSLPAVGAGSPIRETPGVNAQGFGMMGSSAAAAADRGLNGHAAARSGSGSAAQQHNRASSNSQHYSGGRTSAAVAAAAAAGEGQQVFRSQYRGVSYDKKKRKWRVQIKVAALGKSGVSVGYFDTEDAAARAYDRAAIGLLGRQNCRAILNFPIEEYDNDSVPELVGKSREEVKATLKSERAKMPRRRLTNRRRTSRYLGVGSSNRKNQWQARILYHGKVTHLGYYRTEEEAARVYDKVSISLHGAGAQTNFPIDQYKHEVGSLQQKLSGLTREELQRALGVKPMDKSSKFRGVSKKKGRWEAKVMLNRKWAYREMFDTEMEAARAYDTAVWRLKPREARNYVNFKDTCPPDVAEVLKAADKDVQLELHPTGLPLTAKPLIDAGLLFDDEGQSIRAPNGMTRTVSIGDLISLGDSATHSASEPSAGNGSGSAGAQAAHSSGGASGGATGAVAGAPEGPETMTVTFGNARTAAGKMVKSASYSALSGLEAGAVTSNMSNLVASPPDPAAAAAAPVPASSLAAMGRGIHGELTTHRMSHLGVQQQQQQQLSSSFDGSNFFPQHQHQQFGQQHSGFTGGMPRVQSVPQLRSMDAGSPSLPPVSNSSRGPGGLQSFGSHPIQHMQQHQQQYSHHPQSEFGGHNSSMHYGGGKLEGTFWNTELSYQDQHQQQQQQQQQQQHHGMRMSRSCGSLAFMAGNSSPTQPAPPAAVAAPSQAPTMLSSPGLGSPGNSLQGTFSGSAGDFAGESRPLMVRVGSEQHLISANPTTNFKSGMSRIASESHLSSMVPVSPSGNQFIGPERGLFESSSYTGVTLQQQQQPQQQYHFGGVSPQQQLCQQQQQQPYQQQHYGAAGVYGAAPMGGSFMQQPQQQMGLPQGPPGSFYPSAVPQQATPMTQAMGVMQGSAGGVMGMNPSGNPQQPRPHRNSSSTMHRAHSCATLESIDETAVFRTYGLGQSNSADLQGMMQGANARSHSMPGGPVGASFGMQAQQQMPQQQQQQLAGMVGSPAMYSTGGPGLVQHASVPGQQQQAGHFGSQISMPGQQGMMGPPVSTGSVYGQSPTAAATMLPTPAAPMTGAAAAEAFGASAAASAGMGYSVDSAAAGSIPAGPAAAIAAGNMKPWQDTSNSWGPGSPLGNLQIGGEDLDVAMAFLTDGSPRRLTDADNLDIGLTDFEPGLRLPSPTHSQSTSALLYDSAMQGGLDAGDLGMRMDE